LLRVRRPGPRIPHQITHTLSTSLNSKRFGSIADMAMLRSSVLEGIEAGDVETAEQAEDALSAFERLVAQAGSLHAAAAQLRVVDRNTPIEPGVHLLNAHTGKGQQFDWVFIPGFEDFHIPDSRADTPDTLAEELRVVLVMVSRARHGVVVSSARSLISNAGRPYATRASRWWPVITAACLMTSDDFSQHIAKLEVPAGQDTPQATKRP
ncbi:3'-5' exonuclease, partial [Streptomyces sp. NPDC001728]|uniref:3'-5' exonuclease n=1 Tax=Streptomyces sp. NPDC001728 TaxID=3154396 RepID=UPI00331E9E4B